MTKVRFLCNGVEGGWEPEDLKISLGGSEEAVISLAEEFSKDGFDVIVYRTPREHKTDYIYNGVLYQPQSKVICEPNDIFISFKVHVSPKFKFKAKAKIHWSADIEQPRNVSDLDAFVCISEYHSKRLVWVPNHKKYAFPLGIDIEALKKVRTRTDPGLILYCSSFDRGLETLLDDWEEISKNNRALKLVIAYGIEGILKYGGADKVRQANNLLAKISKLDNIQYMGALSNEAINQMYWKAEYWIHPLNRADSELFCLNAVKARFVQTTPVVKKIGALRNTVGAYVKYEDFKDGSRIISDINQQAVVPQSWGDIYENHWKPLIQKITLEKGN